MALPTLWNPLRRANRFDPVRFDPITDLEELFRGLGGRSMARTYEKALEMPMDVRENEKAFLIDIDMPGVRKEDIDVTVEGNQVTISADVKREESRDNEKEVYCERFEGKAYRSFTLPTDVQLEKSQARYDGGVLKLTLPKTGETKSRRLSIN